MLQAKTQTENTQYLIDSYKIILLIKLNLSKQ
jgi:hypothetical protein